MANPRRVFVIGAGMTKFTKPNKLDDYPEMGVEAATKALVDAGINYDQVESAFVGYVYGDSTSGQRALYAMGLTGIPIINSLTRGADLHSFSAVLPGSSALFLARQNVAYGITECSMALGFEKMQPGSLSATYDDRANPLSKTIEMMNDTVGMSDGPFAAQIFGNGAAEYIKNYGAKWDHVGAIAAKNHQHSVHNPYSQFRNSMTTEQVMNDKKITTDLTRAMCCPTSNGGACVLVASLAFVLANGLENQAIEIAGIGMATDSTRLFEERSAIELTGADMTRKAAKMAFGMAGVGPSDMQVVELHDCFAANELLVYDALGLCEPGKAHDLVERKDFTYGGKYLINPSGGLESKGHPLGATGLGMTFYLINQLRGWAGPMQMPEVVPGVMEKQGKTAYALLHNLGLGGSAVVAVFKRPDFYNASKGIDGRARAGYNPACNYKPVSQSDVDKVKSVRAYSKFADANL